MSVVAVDNPKGTFLERKKIVRMWSSSRYRQSMTPEPSCRTLLVQLRLQASIFQRHRPNCFTYDRGCSTAICSLSIGSFIVPEGVCNGSLEIGVVGVYVSDDQTVHNRMFSAPLLNSHVKLLISKIRSAVSGVFIVQGPLTIWDKALGWEQRPGCQGSQEVIPSSSFTVRRPGSIMSNSQEERCGCMLWRQLDMD